MKEIKRCFCNFSYYDQQAIQEKLEEMAEKGWMLEKPGSFMWTYKRITPKRLRFSVTYFPNASDFDPGPTDGELTKIDYCRQDGWILVTSWGVMQIFYNKNVDATPIETEPVTQIVNSPKNMYPSASNYAFSKTTLLNKEVQHSINTKIFRYSHPSDSVLAGDFFTAKLFLKIKCRFQPLEVVV